LPKSEGGVGKVKLSKNSLCCSCADGVDADAAGNTSGVKAVFDTRADPLVLPLTVGYHAALTVMTGKTKDAR
jgi:hypothetical protein